MKATALKKQLEEDKVSISIIHSSFQPSNPTISIKKQSVDNHKVNLGLSPPKKNNSQSKSQEAFQCRNMSLDHEYTQAKECLSTIEDPLWKRVCQDVIRIMGPASFLEIWGCILGETYSQNKNIDIYCPTERETQFIKQYSFVILGSLKTYFPALKQINIKNNSSLERT